MQQHSGSGEGIFNRGVITILALLSGIFFVVSVYMTTTIVGDKYVGIYYTVAVLFDAFSFLPNLSVPLFTSQFYELYSLLLLDGVIKIAIIGFLTASVIGAILSIDLKAKLNLILAKRFRNHVVLCGYSRLSERLIRDLTKRKIEFLVVERNKDKVEILKNLGHIVIEGDFTNDLVLNEVSVKTARAVVFDTKDDFNNVLGIIAMKRINRNVKAIVRVNDEDSITNLVHAGADLYIIPEILAGAELGENITKAMGVA